MDCNGQSVRRVFYYIPKYDFFMKGIRGSVIHAFGFIHGLVMNNLEMELISGPIGTALADHVKVDQQKKIKLNELKQESLFFWWFKFIRNLVRNVKSDELIVIRWRPLCVLFIPFLKRSEKVWFEVNSITGSSSKNIIIKTIARASFCAIASRFDIITVSESNKNRINSLCRSPKNVFVIPNGFRSDIFSNYKASFDVEDKRNLLYFGKQQPYYDWDIYFRVLDDLVKNGNINALYIWGFNLNNGHENIISNPTTKDQFELIDKISRVTNPILVIPVSASDVGSNGSPMKLFEFGAMGIPLIISDSIAMQASSIKHAILYKAGSKTDLHEKINDVAVNYEKYLLMARESAKEVEEGYSWEAVVRKWIDNGLSV